MNSRFPSQTKALNSKGGRDLKYLIRFHFVNVEIKDM